jgi:hypothetical protein
MHSLSTILFFLHVSRFLPNNYLSALHSLRFWGQGALFVKNLPFTTSKTQDFRPKIPNWFFYRWGVLPQPPFSKFLEPPLHVDVLKMLHTKFQKNWTDSVDGSTVNINRSPSSLKWLQKQKMSKFAHNRRSKAEHVKFAHNTRSKSRTCKSCS